MPLGPREGCLGALVLDDRGLEELNSSVTFFGPDIDMAVLVGTGPKGDFTGVHGILFRSEQAAEKGRRFTP
jgi:hypothetical protein